jgi:hypothetical protein
MSIEAKMYRELKERIEAHEPTAQCIPEWQGYDRAFREIKVMCTEIERRYLSKRVAEILGNLDVGRFHAAAFAAEYVRGDPEIEYMVREIRAALESGNTTEIEKWGKSNNAIRPV